MPHARDDRLKAPAVFVDSVFSAIPQLPREDIVSSPLLFRDLKGRVVGVLFQSAHNLAQTFSLVK